jgi:hypothetical protein
MPNPPPTLLGWQNEPLPFTLAVPLNAPRAEGIVFPGAAYTQDRPLCTLPRDVLVAAGAEVICSTRYYGMDAHLSALTGEEREACLVADSGAFARAAFERAAGRPVILAGKSLGTTAMAHALAQVPDLAKGWSIWLTPLWKDDAIFKAIAAAGSRAYVLVGTADPQWDPAILEALQKRSMKVAKSAPVVQVVEGADHGMTVAGNPAATAKVLTDLKPALVAHVAAAIAAATPAIPPAGAAPGPTPPAP